MREWIGIKYMQHTYRVDVHHKDVVAEAAEGDLLQILQLYTILQSQRLWVQYHERGSSDHQDYWDTLGGGGGGGEEGGGGGEEEGRRRGGGGKGRGEEAGGVHV